MPTDPPEGFEPHFRQSPVTNPWEPLFSRRIDGTVQIGLWLREVHCNSRGLLHGGVIAALADNAMGLSCGSSLPSVQGLVTVSLTVDYVGSCQDRPMAADRATRAPDRQVDGFCRCAGHGGRRDRRACQRHVSRHELINDLLPRLRLTVNCYRRRRFPFRGASCREDAWAGVEFEKSRWGIRCIRSPLSRWSISTRSAKRCIYIRDDIQRVPGMEKAADRLTAALAEIAAAERRRLAPVSHSVIDARLVLRRKH